VQAEYADVARDSRSRTARSAEATEERPDAALDQRALETSLTEFVLAPDAREKAALVNVRFEFDGEGCGQRLFSEYHNRFF
jgi:hypothetical protein